MQEVSSAKNPAIFPQLLAVTSASLSSLATGIAYGWSSPVGLKLVSNDTSATPVGHTFSAESEEIAWITSLFIIGILITSLVASYLADKIGRKWTLLCSAIFFIISYVMFIFAYDIAIIYAGRIVQGFGAGVMVTTLPLFIGEIATNNIRGAMGSILSIFLTGGLLYAYAWGAYVSYLLFQVACVAIPIIFVVLFLFMPESPYYLIAKGDKKGAHASLKFLRRQPTEALEEAIQKIQAMVEASATNKASILEIFRNRGNLKAFVMCFGLIGMQQFSGVQSVMFNTQIIFEKTHTSIDSGLASIIVVVFQVGAACISLFLIDRMGRKILLLTSLAVMGVVLAILGLYFYLNQSGADTSSIFWLPLAALVTFFIFNATGILPIPFVMIGEVFAPNVKFNASAILAMSGAVMGFVTTRTYPPMLTVGIYFPFWIYALLCFLGFIFVWFVVVETKGLSFEEIQDMINKQ